MKTLIRLIVLITPLVFFGLAMASDLPVNPDVTQATIHKTICVPGYSASVRPGTTYTNWVKERLLDEAGLSWQDAWKYELDHRLSLELGGHPRALRNLVLQPWDGPDGAHAKDVVENWLHRMVCLGKIPLAAAQDCLYNRWRQCRKEFSK